MFRFLFLVLYGGRDLGTKNQREQRARPPKQEANHVGCQVDTCSAAEQRGDLYGSASAVRQSKNRKSEIENSTCGPAPYGAERAHRPP